MKAQMKFQKILSLASLILSALTIVYALGFFTGNMSDILYYIASNHSKVDVIGADEFINTAQSFISTLVVLGIVYLLCVVTLYITQSNARRKYYITNYISVILVAAFALVLAIYIIAMESVCLNLFLNGVDWAKYEVYQAANASLGALEVSKSCAVFVIGYILSVIILIDVAALVYNLVWKILLMKGEKELLDVSASKTSKEVA
jgi:hypothetical protein